MYVNPDWERSQHEAIEKAEQELTTRLPAMVWEEPVHRIPLFISNVIWFLVHDMWVKLAGKAGL